MVHSIIRAFGLQQRLREEEWFHLGEVGDLRDIIIVTHHHHHSSVSYASMPVSDIKPPKNTSNRDHIRCKEMSVVNHDGYTPRYRSCIIMVIHKEYVGSLILVEEVSF